MRRIQVVPDYGTSTKSRYYIGADIELGEVRITKPKDPELMEKNKAIIDKHRKDAAKRRSIFISKGQVF